ncbi:hypothetical protein MEQU1_003454 [Malassezia equina]|uniref:Uncharacterized protein n=1 Tax=Malassezia equina TaxID=1381935 RepID=A0AAF0EFM0_9BASI|nr:hypothetical protein MEQU1_003454 [Malassezia equina]
MSLNATAILPSVNTTFMVGSQENIFTTCSQLAFVLTPGTTNQTYFGWASNFSSLLPVLENIPANMKYEPISFVCLSDEGFHATPDTRKPLSQYNFTTGVPLEPEPVLFLLDIMTYMV